MWNSCWYSQSCALKSQLPPTGIEKVRSGLYSHPLLSGGVLTLWLGLHLEVTSCVTRKYKTQNSIPQSIHMSCKRIFITASCQKTSMVNIFRKDYKGYRSHGKICLTCLCNNLLILDKILYNYWLHSYMYTWFFFFLFNSLKMMLLKCYTPCASKFGKLCSGHRTGKGQFSFQSQRREKPKNVKTTTQLHSVHMLAR